MKKLRQKTLLFYFFNTTQADARKSQNGVPAFPLFYSYSMTMLYTGFLSLHKSNITEVSYLSASNTVPVGLSQLKRTKKEAFHQFSLEF